MKIMFEELIEWLYKEDLKHMTTKNGLINATQDFALLEEIICEKCTPKQIYHIAKLGLKSTNINKLAQAIIKSKDPLYNYLFAKNIDKADIKAHEQVVIDSKDPEYNYYFASDIIGADIKAHGQVVFESKNPTFIFWFKKTIKSDTFQFPEESVSGNAISDDVDLAEKETASNHSAEHLKLKVIKENIHTLEIIG